ncbi:D-alanine--poly(phosphoribitol) ligase subunit DltC [Companilactobacillus sp.]|jgi:D-alanine--poly(phosphoribitol) ligase subunit 2|uniref:D-alanine--poly(phosphoribitol) ligase subunit DltC n=1 Tax=Companilactobacillus sp. TaxID=2767905 RepID=UPI0025C3DD28|nr:D-alanine--poly(phosphoribitol) ligase subunit DltC [Companilactobacillus sp.]MCH4010019.1 D-alanine--poly(phosphoribitol) ligase subunit DltC [Companilactobacillus sp.]MCH4052305.1 D-alanine--poly(phosphoribitol) ligase subunit DltC [Companilactobacillus sp.]MCH4077961.1 D-alanine--poly(phosphoribitol) ligase subunit DltC [Companilactobacillus sp.]MCH4126537.1 D-alanine--poly(phosphoribitol) ligase subunit DltC [Companilactobacillus sp.]MCH4132123.1 D-alanine--poly(phosphoribitol) ligase s
MDVKAEIIAILKDVTGLDDVGSDPDANLFQDGVLDSMATVEVLVAMQDKFDIQVPVSEFDRNQWNTVNKMVDRVGELEEE